MSEDDRERLEHEAIAIYQESYRKLLGLAVHLIESDRDLAPMNEIIDGLTESEAKGLLKVLIAFDGNDYAERRRGGLRSTDGDPVRNYLACRYRMKPS